MTLCLSASGLFLSIKYPFYGCVFVLVAILETLYAGLFYLFVWHLAGFPQGEVHAVAKH